MDLSRNIPLFRKDFGAEEFKIWTKLIEDLMVTKNLKRDKTKLAMLRVIGGMELVELLNGLFVTEIEEYEVVMAALVEHFEQKNNSIQERMEFRKLKQVEGERLRQFSVRL